MKVLFLTLARFDDIEQSGIYHDLLRKFRDDGHQVTIVCPNERKFKKKTQLFNFKGVDILKVWTTNIQKTNILEKGITTLSIEYLYSIAISKYLNSKDFDLILYSTPPITFTNLIKKLKSFSNAKTYLLLKDIFPQNAVDLNLLKSGNILYKYFRKREKELYHISDFIGCMSRANLDYILKNNPEIDISKLEVNPNSIELKEIFLKQRIKLYEKYNIPRDKIIFIFGGNLGIPQGIDFLKKNIVNCKSISEAFFLIIGDGTEYNKFKHWIKFDNIKNVLLIKEIPKYEYDQVIKLSHVGLIFLNPFFTIPNFPSRILTYMENKLPVICATDNVTDIGEIASKNNFGYSCLTYDYNSFTTFVKKLLNNDLRCHMGENAYNYFVEFYNVDVSYKKIIDKLNI
jgi:hypothetical protein